MRLDSLKPLMFVIMVLCTIPSVIFMAYAENETPYGEWDFNFEEIDVKQNPNNLKELIITPTVYYEGFMPLGSVVLEMIVIDPLGSEFSYAGQLSDIPDLSSRELTWFHPMRNEGSYTLSMRIITTSIEFPGHIFDTKEIVFTVPENGFERKLDIIATDEGERLSYKLASNETVQKFERLHVSFNLLDDHNFGEIHVTNGKFQDNHSVYTEELYVQSENYSDMKVSLVDKSSIIPFADAQSEILEYVKMTAVHENVCYSVDCKSIDYVESEIEEQEFPYWMLMFLDVLAVIPLLMKKKSKKMDTDCIHKSTHYMSSLKAKN